MFVEHVELFRCLVPHEDSWLVAAARRTEGRRILDGTLGCPICRATYPIVDGVAWFGVDLEPAPFAEGAAPDEALVVRAAALLGLQEPGGTVALAGAWAVAGAALAELTRVRPILLDAPPGTTVPDEATLVRSTRLPIGAGLLRGVALDADHAHGDAVASAAHALQQGGRLVAPASTPLPRDHRELARDDRDWVAERVAVASAPVPLAIVRR